MSAPDDTAYTLRSMHPDDVETVRQLWHDGFGGAEDTMTNWLDAVFQSRFRVVGTVAVAGDGSAATEDQNVVGFGLLDVATQEHSRKYLGLDDLDVDADLADLNGILHMYCVDPSWRGRGIATGLFAAHLRHLVDKDVPRAFGISWHRDDHPDSRTIFDKFGFTSLGAYERFYDRTGERQHCPDCGGYCTCTASIYALTLDDVSVDVDDA